ncbi:VanZ family protein [uncultured Ilyobacter sp.]|uniref:VanZ family protein n=1 Tax=uncultured Ilyobacter sp. TaxID=544433 RepID=UPI0029F5B686|nr:VanZ family protein [uncultured Ilyobacter sp.]
MKKYFSVIISILIMIIIFKFSSEDIGRSLKHSDTISRLIRSIFSDGIFLSVRKLAHFFIYFFLATFLQLNFSDNCRKSRNKITVILIVFIYACSDEFHQSFVSGRGSRFTDVLIDSAGGMTSILMIEMWRRFKERRSDHQWTLVKNK